MGLSPRRGPFPRLALQASAFPAFVVLVDCDVKSCPFWRFNKQLLCQIRRVFATNNSQHNISRLRFRLNSINTLKQICQIHSVRFSVIVKESRYMF